MPQLDASTYLTQIFWLILTFISLWFIMARFIIPGIAETVEARRRKYNDYILKAEEVNEKALFALKRYESTLAAAKAKAAEQIARNEKELRDILAQKEEEINLELKQKIAENEERLAKERAETLEKIESLSQNTAYMILQGLNLDFITRADIEEITTKGE